MAQARLVEPGGAVRLEGLIGADILTRDGEEVGEIEDFLFIPGSRGEVYALVDREGWFGFGTDLVVAPLTQLRWTEEDEVVTEATEAQWEQAPKFERDAMSTQLAEEADRYWAGRAN